MTELEAIELWRLIDEYMKTAINIFKGDKYVSGTITLHAAAEDELTEFIAKLVQE